jgi:hypothetical protein
MKTDFTPADVRRVIGRCSRRLIDSGVIRGEWGRLANGLGDGRIVRRPDLLAYLGTLDEGHRAAALGILGRIDARKARAAPC